MKKIKLGEILKVKRGASLSGEYYSDKGEKIRLTLGNFDYPGKGFKVNSSKNDLFFIGQVKPEFILKKGDIITPLTEQVAGLLGETAEIPCDNTYIQSGDIGLVKIEEGLADKNYVYYLLSSQSIKKQLGAAAQQTKIRHTSPDKIEGCIAWIPDDINMQMKIGRILKSIDNQINRNKDMVQKLQVLGNTIFNKTFKDEKSYCALTKFPYIDFIKPGINKFSGEKRYLATAEVNNEDINFDADKITYDNREGRANMQPVSNSVRFAKMKSSIKHMYITEEESLLTNNYIFSTGFCGIKCESFVLEYMINYIKLPYFEIFKDKLSHGATQQAVNNDDLMSMKIAIPNKGKLQKFHESTKNIYKQITQINESNVSLTRLKNRLIPLLINGQLI